MPGARIAVLVLDVVAIAVIALTLVLLGWFYFVVDGALVGDIPVVVVDVGLERVGLIAGVQLDLVGRVPSLVGLGLQGLEGVGVGRLVVLGYLGRMQRIVGLGYPDFRGLQVIFFPVHDCNGGSYGPGA